MSELPKNLILYEQVCKKVIENMKNRVVENWKIKCRELLKMKEAMNIVV